MAISFTDRKRMRKNFGRIREVAPMPNLIEVQLDSYKHFLQMDVAPEKRKALGLQEVFRSVFPIKDFADRAELEFVKYELEAPKFDVEECQQRGVNFAAPLKVTLRLVVWDVDEETGARSIRDIKEQAVYMGDMPLMTDKGTFIINGTERVIVSQMHRSPGVFFDHDKGKTHSSGKFLFAARVIPYRGSWLDFEFDAKDHLYVRIDRRRKLPATTLLYALPSAASEALLANAAEHDELNPPEIQGMSSEEILGQFYESQIFTRLAAPKSLGEGDELTLFNWKTKFVAERFRGSKLTYDLVDGESFAVHAKMGEKLTQRTTQKLVADGLKDIAVPDEELISRYVASDIINETTGEIFAEAGDEITPELLNILAEAGVSELKILVIDHVTVGPHLRNTLKIDRNQTREDALMDIYRLMRPGEPHTLLETAETLFKQLFFDLERYDLSSVGRVKMNARLGLDAPDTERVLRKADILAILKILCDLKDGRGDIDDIDHLGNRRVRSVGELMENQYRLGLLRMERAIRERMNTVEIDSVMPNDLINAKPAAASVREFFGSSQLSQFMDQTNPLSEITHKRRLSALGPGGLTRERAGFEVRDVHPTHYGRICPIETPEGPNIGLINSLATFARVNQYGFIEAPYRKVKDGIVTDEVVYLSANEEGRFLKDKNRYTTVAEANSELRADRGFVDELVSCRQGGDYIMARPQDIDLIDVSPKQLVSVAAALIPFLENDDANRALMGSNMQRQAVPLIRAEAPLVGTGMESRVARDSGVSIIAKRSGIIDQVDAKRIVVRAMDKSSKIGTEVAAANDAAGVGARENGARPAANDAAGVGAGRPAANESAGVDIYNLLKFQRSNQNTCITQRPLVKVGDVVGKGDIIADGPSTELGELALGRNVLCAFMPWNGYNFEDSILISERIVSDDVFTSIHIEEFEVMARDTKMGEEQITRDIPNLSEESLKNLDEAGMVYIGAEVKAGDILVGKVTPKGESPMTPEEKLLRAIFGEKSSEVRDSSMRVPPGVSGTIVDVRVFTRRGLEKDERARAIERGEIQNLAKDRDDEKIILERSFFAQLHEALLGQNVTNGPKGTKIGGKVTEAMLEKLTPGQWRQIGVEDETAAATIETLNKQFDESIKRLNDRFENKVDKLQRGDELPPGVMKMVKVFVAVKRKLQPGDKMAGRHGNKGVISRITPLEDMPYLEDGTPVDVVLNPLGVPSRMNIGQILETHLGWASAGLGRQIGDMSEKIKRLTKTDGNTAEVKSLQKDLTTQLGKIYDASDEKSRLAELSPDEIIEMAGNLRHGVPFATPVFDGARAEDIVAMLEKAGLAHSGQVDLTDGRTGEKFDRQVTVGYIYMLKLHHLVDDKIHARSIGPYSLVTQQPLGGKAQFGGQRFGEMEVWALEAYGAAYTLQEMLTVKSDDVSGRTKVYESIVRGDDKFQSGIPESFNVLVMELRSLCLNVELKADRV